jgi:Holliday junction resolvasome RuvABC endonuclease subunit
MNTDSIFTIMGIDPGNNLGVAVLSVDESTEQIIGVKTHLKILDKGRSPESSLNVFRLTTLSTYLPRLFNIYKPTALGYESAFVDRRFPASGLSLSIIVGGIITNSLQHGVENIYSFAPKEIKKSFSVAGANKTDMGKAAILDRRINKLIDLSVLSEHEVDALAVALILYEYIIHTR